MYFLHDYCVNTYNDSFRMFVRRTNARGPRSRTRQVLDTLIKKLRDIVKKKKASNSRRDSLYPTYL
jgi:hypothetical protein